MDLLLLHTSVSLLQVCIVISSWSVPVYRELQHPRGLLHSGKNQTRLWPFRIVSHLLTVCLQDSLSFLTALHVLQKLVCLPSGATPTSPPHNTLLQDHSSRGAHKLQVERFLSFSQNKNQLALLRTLNLWSVRMLGASVTTHRTQFTLLGQCWLLYALISHL